MPTIELSLEQLKDLQDIFLLINALKSTAKLSERFDMPGIEVKVDSLIGDKGYMFKRQGYEDSIRECFENNPSKMKRLLKKLDANMPLPEAYKQH